MLLVLFFMVEFRVEHPLLPFRIFMNRTRAASFVAMMLLPAAMFSMFFFLSLFIQNVMGYSPLKAGFAFLPFSICIIISATIVSSLASRIDPRYIAGVGTLMASAALFGFSRLTVPDSGSDVLNAVSQGHALGSDVSYWTQILPYVCLMALGMGAVFVPLTLTAVHHVRAEDSGIGSGVLNTMQQIGGALGPGDPVDGGEPLHQQPHRQDRADDRPGAVQPRPEHQLGADGEARGQHPERPDRRARLRRELPDRRHPRASSSASS